MAKSWEKVAKSGNKWLGVAICGFMWLKVVLCRPFWMSEIHFRSHFWPLQQFRSIRNLNFFGNFFDKMAAVGNFGCPKFTFDHISGHFRSIGHFGFPKFTFDRNSGHFRLIRNFIVFFRRPFSIAFLAISDQSAILDVQNSLSMAFLAISDPYGY